MKINPVGGTLPPASTAPGGDVRGMVRIDADGHIFIEDPNLAARLEETYWANNKPDTGVRRGVPVSWERPSSNYEKREEREALRVLNPEKASATPDAAAASATPNAAALSATPDTAGVLAASDTAGVSTTFSALKPPVVNSLCNC